MKASMSGQKLPLLHRLFSSWSILRAYQADIFGNARAAVRFHNQLCEIISTHLNMDVEKTRILDLGCGQTATQVALFHADGAEIVGIDMEVPTYRMNVRTFLRVLKTNGLERAVKSLTRHVLFDRRFFAELSLQYGKRVPFDGIRTGVMNAASLSFPDNSLDFIYSAWVFEHIDDVPAAIREVNRVLKPSGIAWIGIHLFPSLSGGHHLDWVYPDTSPSGRVPPWDHLLHNTHPVNIYLNKYRLDQYRAVFDEHMDLLDENLSYEGEKLLTPEREAMLRDRGYSREDLLTRRVIFLCRKRVNATANESDSKRFPAAQQQNVVPCAGRPRR